MPKASAKTKFVRKSSGVARPPVARVRPFLIHGWEECRHCQTYGYGTVNGVCSWCREVGTLDDTTGEFLPAEEFPMLSGYFAVEPQPGPSAAFQLEPQPGPATEPQPGPSGQFNNGEEYSSGEEFLPTPPGRRLRRLQRRTPSPAPPSSPSPQPSPLTQRDPDYQPSSSEEDIIDLCTQ